MTVHHRLTHISHNVRAGGVSTIILGEGEVADRLQAELIEKHEQEAAYNIAYVIAYRGAADAAFDFLNEAVTYGDPGLTDIVAEPLFVLDRVSAEVGLLQPVPFVLKLGASLDY